MENEKSAHELLSEVRKFAAIIKDAHRSCTFSDYEHFKQMFISKGYYGYESEIASILNL